MFRILLKVGWDTVPSVRKVILTAMLEDKIMGENKKGAKDIANLIHYPNSTVRNYLEDFWVLKIVDKGGDEDGLWGLSNGFMDHIRGMEG